MSEKEVISCIKNHLQGRFNKGMLTKQDRKYCVTMIMDFLPGMTKKEATEFFRKHILKDLTFDSTDISGIKYVKGDGGAWVYLLGFNVKLHIDEDNLISFGTELCKIGKAYSALEG